MHTLPASPNSPIGAPWTREQDDWLRASSLHAAALAKAAAERFGIGRTEASVRSRARKLGLTLARDPAGDISRSITNRIEPGAPPPQRREAAVRPATRSAVRLVDLEPDQCRFPVGEREGLEQLFCGRVAIPRQAYCPRCRHRAYQAQSRMSEAEVEAVLALAGAAS